MDTKDLKFFGLGIAPKLMETIGRLGFTRPTPIQYKAIPAVLDGQDVIGVAQTGTGKTLAFGLPGLQRLAAGKGRMLVLVPTRELALQVEESLTPFLRAMKMKAAVFIGGAPLPPQIRALAKDPRLLIATPGRLIDLLQQRALRLKDVEILVLDEADRMLDMGFAPQIERILEEVPARRQTLLFSATMPPAIVRIASTHMRVPVQVEIAPSGTAAEGVSHELYIVRKDMKRDLLRRILEQYRGPVLLFCRTKLGVRKVVRALRAQGCSVAEMHSDRTLPQRRAALEGFKKGTHRILAATDIAARGIDVSGIELVINYDLPDEPENYVHRIGRTGRAGRPGHAISFATPDQRTDVLHIERLIKTTIPVSPSPDGQIVEFEKPKTVFSGRMVHGRWKSSYRPRRRR